MNKLEENKKKRVFEQLSIVLSFISTAGFLISSIGMLFSLMFYDEVPLELGNALFNILMMLAYSAIISGALGFLLSGLSVSKKAVKLNSFNQLISIFISPIAAFFLASDFSETLSEISDNTVLNIAVDRRIILSIIYLLFISVIIIDKKLIRNDTANIHIWHKAVGAVYVFFPVAFALINVYDFIVLKLFA